MHDHTDHQWRERALCLRHDPEIFFPVGHAGPAAAQTINAKLICRRCPVIAPCLGFAMKDPSQEGIWGGTDRDERQAFVRKMRQVVSV